MVEPPSFRLWAGGLPFGLLCRGRYRRHYGSNVKGACGGVDYNLGVEVVGWLLLSSSHVEVVISSKRRLLGHVAGVGVVQGGNNIVKYCWMIGLGIT